MSISANLDRLYTTDECRRLTRFGRSAFYELVRDRDGDDPFPAPLILGTRYLFAVEEVDAWLGRRPRGLRPRSTAASGRTESRKITDVASDGASLFATLAYAPRRRRRTAA